MRKVSLQSQPTITAPVLRMCQRQGCTKELTPQRKRWCCNVCKHIAISGGNGGGKVSTYKKEYATTLFREYIEEIKKANEPSMIPTGQNALTIRENCRLPSMKNYKLFIWEKEDRIISLDAMQAWCGENEEFAKAMDFLHELQENFLTNNGLSGAYTQLISRLLLGANHGIVEKKEIDNKHKLVGVVKHFYEDAEKKKKELFPHG